jgi:hypothetical protein
VKMSTTTPSRSSAPSPALPASNPVLLRASDDATSIVILSPEPVPQAPPTGAGISPPLSVPSAFLCLLCVKAFAFLGAAWPQNRQFLFNTNAPPPNFVTHTKQTASLSLLDPNNCLSRTPNLAIHTKQTTSSQITSSLLFRTNEKFQFTNHQSLITTHQSLITTHQSLITTHQSLITHTGSNLS